MLKVRKRSVDQYVNNLESVNFSTEMCILQTRAYWKGEIHAIKVLCSLNVRMK